MNWIHQTLGSFEAFKCQFNMKIYCFVCIVSRCEKEEFNNMIKRFLMLSDYEREKKLSWRAHVILHHRKDQAWSCFPINFPSDITQSKTLVNKAPMSISDSSSRSLFTISSCRYLLKHRNTRDERNFAIKKVFFPHQNKKAPRGKFIVEVELNMFSRVVRCLKCNKSRRILYQSRVQQNINGRVLIFLHAWALSLHHKSLNFSTFLSLLAEIITLL